MSLLKNSFEMFRLIFRLPRELWFRSSVAAPVPGPIVAGVSVSLFDSQSPDGMYVSLWMKGFQRKPLDGGDKCAIEVQSPSKVIGGLFIERIRTGPGALKSIQGILKRWNRRFGATSCAHCLWL